MTRMDEVRRLLDVLCRSLEDTIVGAWLFGSAVTGGLHPHSDIDILVAVNQPVRGALRRTLIAELMAVSGSRAADGPARPAEVTVVVHDDVVPWRFPPRSDLVFGEWLRDEFEAGRIAPPAFDPDLAILLTTARQHSRTLVGPDARALFDPVPQQDLRRAIVESLPRLLGDLRGDERNVLLTLARMWVTLATGEIVPKDVAARWVLQRLPPEHGAALDLARRAYLGECGDDWRQRTQEVDAFVLHAQQAIARLAAS